MKTAAWACELGLRKDIAFCGGTAQQLQVGELIQGRTPKHQRSKDTGTRMNPLDWLNSLKFQVPTSRISDPMVSFAHSPELSRRLAAQIELLEQRVVLSASTFDASSFGYCPQSWH